MNLQESILTILAQTRNEILANMSAKNINASGRTANSLKAEAYEGGVRLYFAAGDRAPMDTLEIGRPGGAVPRNFTDIIEQWSKDKGLNWGSDKQRRKIAGAVAWGKIRRFGTDRNTNPVDVYSTAMEKAKEQIAKVVLVPFQAEIKNTINNFE